MHSVCTPLPGVSTLLTGTFIVNCIKSRKNTGTFMMVSSVTYPLRDANYPAPLQLPPLLPAYIPFTSTYTASTST